jgi:predicted RNA-binding Zn-ribbon protein involved in translation (DUF1610 family)
MIPWRLTKRFDDERHLFSGIIKTDYFIDSFVCSCGHKDFVIYKRGERYEYACPKCGNETFYDANSIKRNIVCYIVDDPVVKQNSCHKLYVDDKKIRAFLSTMVPSDIDFLREKVFYTSIENEYLELYLDGKLKISEYYSEDRYELFEEMILSYVNKNKDLFSLPLNNITLQEAMFFLKHKNLKDYEFYFWESWYSLNYLPKHKPLRLEDAFTVILNNRKERSVKKAIYQNYEFQLHKYARYNLYLVMLFIQKIKNPDILVSLLKLDIYKNLFLPKSINMLLDFLLFRYSQKQIYGFFSELEDAEHNYMMYDIFYYIDNLSSRADFFKKSKKVKCSIKSLHDKLTELNREKDEKRLTNKTIKNNTDRFKPCIDIDGYKVKIPRDGQELFEWSAYMHNCMASYYDVIANMDTTIYCFFIDSHIDFAVEIADGELIQASGVNNRMLTFAQARVLKRWIRRYFGEREMDRVDSMAVPVEIVYGKRREKL